MKHCALYKTACVWMILFICSVTNAEDKTIQSCLNEPYRNASMEDLDNVEIEDVIYYLYKMNSTGGLTWCEAHQACRASGQNLTVLNTMALQSEITGLNMTGVTGDVWISGRRKDYGADWTWINNTLDNYTGVLDKEGDDDCLRVFWFDELKHFSSDCTGLRMSFCTVGSNNEIKRDWYTSQNECVKKGGRLPTADEFIQRVDGLKITNELYWVGSSYRPWLWVSENVSDNQPVLYSSWSAVPVDGDCMALEPNGSWTTKQCDQRLDHFICQANKVDPTKADSVNEDESGESVGPDNETKTIIVAVVVSVIVVIIIIITVWCVLHMRQKRPPTNNNHLEANPDQAPENRYVEGAADQNPPDSTSYKPGAEYAEVGVLPAKSTTTSAPGPGYTLATRPKGPAPGAPEPAYAVANEPRGDAEAARGTRNGDVYSEVKKPADETTLVENVTYAPFDPHQKNPKPKPPRKPPQK